MRVAVLALGILIGAVEFLTAHLVRFGLALHNSLALLVGGGFLAGGLALRKRERGVWQTTPLVVGIAMILIHAVRLAAGF